MKKLFLIIITILFLSCCREEPDPYQGIYFYVQYPGSHIIFFYNTDPDGISSLYVTGEDWYYAYLEEDLVPIIGELHLMNIVIYKITGSDYPDKGNLIFTVYDDGKQIDKLIIPKGEARAEVDYIF